MNKQGRPKGRAHTVRNFRLSERLSKKLDKKLAKTDEIFSVYMRRLIIRDLKLNIKK